MQSALRHIPCATLFVIIAIVGMAKSAAAQGASATKGPARVYRLTLKPNPAVPSGMAAGAGGTVDVAGHRFQLEHLSLTQPVAVAVIAEHPSRPLDVRLAKYNFDSVERQGQTDSRGQVSFQFRTEGDLLIQVRAATGELAPYSLVVWVGDEIAGEVRAPFVSMKNRSRQDAGHWLSAPVAAGVLGGLACGVIAVFLWRPRRRRRDEVTRQSGTALLIVSLCATTAGAQFLETNVKALAAKELEKALQKAGVDKMIHGALEAANAAAEFQKWQALSPFDSSVDYGPAGAPELPSNCLSSEACRACFEPANARLTRVLAALEKLRRLGAWTRTYKDRALALGNSVASLPLAGLGWAGARKEIEDSYMTFQGRYDAKYKELIASLKSSLQDISACEESVYHENDWYNRFGFIYFQFMAERYRRTD